MKDVEVDYQEKEKSNNYESKNKILKKKRIK